jgi:hypothetical protein
VGAHHHFTNYRAIRVDRPRFYPSGRTGNASHTGPHVSTPKKPRNELFRLTATADCGLPHQPDATELNQSRHWNCRNHRKSGRLEGREGREINLTRRHDRSMCRDRPPPFGTALTDGTG